MEFVLRSADGVPVMASAVVVACVVVAFKAVKFARVDEAVTQNEPVIFWRAIIGLNHHLEVEVAEVSSDVTVLATVGYWSWVVPNGLVVEKVPEPPPPEPQDDQALILPFVVRQFPLDAEGASWAELNGAAYDIAGASKKASAIRSFFIDRLRTKRRSKASHLSLLLPHQS